MKNKIVKLVFLFSILLSFFSCKHNTTKELLRIEIINSAEKLEYFVGEELDTKGLIVNSFYDDGTVEDISSIVTNNIYPVTNDYFSVCGICPAIVVNSPGVK